MTRLLSLVAVMGASACVGSSGFLAYTNMSNKLKRGREEREEEDKIRGRLEKEERKAKYSKEANEAAQGERDEAERKKKEAERIEKEKANWTTFLNNFVILQYIKGDQQAIQKTIPVPLNRQKLKKPRNFKPGYGQHRLPFKYRDDRQPLSLMTEEGRAREIQERLNKKDLEYISAVFDNLTKSGHPMYNISNLKEKTAAEIRILTELGFPVVQDNGKPTELESAFKITQCYEEKTKGMPDYYSLSQADRGKRLRLLLEDCGGSENGYFSWLTVAANSSTKKARFILTNEYAEDGCKGEVVHELMLNPGAKLGAKLPQQSLRGMDACCAQIENMKVESLDAKIGRSDPRIITLRDLDVQNKKVINLTKIEPIPGGEHVICSEDFNATLTISQ